MQLRASRCGHLIALIVNLALVALLLYAGIVLPLWSLWCGCALLFWVLVAAALLVWIHQLLLWCCEPRADEAAAAEPVTKATAALVHSAILSPNPGAGQVAPAGMTPPESRKTTAAKLLRRIVSQAVATQAASATRCETMMPSSRGDNPGAAPRPTERYGRR